MTKDEIDAVLKEVRDNVTDADSAYSRLESRLFDIQGDDGEGENEETILLRQALNAIEERHEAPLVVQTFTNRSAAARFLRILNTAFRHERLEGTIVQKDEETFEVQTEAWTKGPYGSILEGFGKGYQEGYAQGLAQGAKGK